MSDKFKATVRIQRPARMRTDGSGRPVRAESLETVDIELFSTGEIRKILGSKDEAAIKAIEDAAESGDEGVLARNIATGLFEIVDNSDLQAIIEQDVRPRKHEKVADIIYEPAFDSEKSIDELSLVSTMALRKILKEDDVDEPIAEEIDDAGFDPYDSS